MRGYDPPQNETEPLNRTVCNRKRKKKGAGGSGMKPAGAAGYEYG